MILRLSYLYIRGLFGLDLLLLSLSIVLHVFVLRGAYELYARHGQVLFWLAFAFMLPVAFLAKERNIWKNEFSSCPRWLKRGILIFIFYGVAIVVVRVVTVPGYFALESDEPAGSALPLIFEVIPLGVLYSILWSSKIEDKELINRVRLSVISLIVCFGFILAKYFRSSP